MHRSTISVLALVLCVACQGKSASSGESTQAGDAGPVDAADTGETGSDASAPPQKPVDDLIPDADNEITPPPQIVDLAKEVVVGLNADDGGELLKEPLMSREVYITDRMTYGLAKNRKTVEKLPRQFLWDNMNGDSDSDRDKFFKKYIGNPVEFESLRVNSHEDKEEIEIWDGAILRLREKTSGRRVDELWIGEFVHDKVDDEWYLLRYDRRDKR